MTIKAAVFNIKPTAESKLTPKKKKKETGAFRESNSGPLAPKARIIPLDQMPNAWH